jgi:hypothetical protein
MAWNPSEKVKIAREIANKYNKHIIIIYMIDKEKIEFISYGKNLELCNVAEKLAECGLQAIQDYK